MYRSVYAESEEVEILCPVNFIYFNLFSRLISNISIAVWGGRQAASEASVSGGSLQSSCRINLPRFEVFTASCWRFKSCGSLESEKFMKFWGYYFKTSGTLSPGDTVSHCAPSLRRLYGGGLGEGSFTGEPERWGLWGIYEMPCGRACLYIGALLGNLEGVTIVGAFEGNE